MRKIILASASPRRRELLAAAGVIFQICVSEGEEKITAENPDEIVCELSALKAAEIASKFEFEDGTVIIGADTIVSYMNKILGKPSDEQDAFETLKMLQGNIRAGCSIIPKGEVYESHIFTKKEEWFKNKAFTKEVKELFTDTINCYVKEESEKLSVFQQGGVYLAMKKIGKNNPKAEEIKADNAARQEWNRTVDVALVEGVPEEDILKIKQEKITDETLQSIRTHGWLPDMFRQIIRGAKDFLQEVIFKFKLPPRTVPKIDLQEWKDMQKLMYELQGQSREIKRTQQDISSLKKQLSELRGLFKGKERKSLEGKIELLEDLEKRLHRSMGRIVKREGYPNVQSFQKVYNKAEELIMEYNEELRAWKNQTKPKKENPLEQPQKASVLEKLHRYQQEGRQQPKRSVKKKSMDRER